MPRGLPAAAGPAALLIAATLAAAGCGPGVLYLPGEPAAEQQGWTQDAGDAAGTGWAAAGPEPPLTLRWQQDIGKPPLQGPLLAGPLLLQWSQAPDLLAFELATGTRRGRKAANDPVCGAAALAGADDRLLLTTVLDSPPELRALDRVTGDVVWAREGAVCAPLVVRGDTVYAAAEGGTLEALDTAAGRLLWRLAGEGLRRTAPSLRGDTLFLATGGGELLAAGVDSGRVRWRARLSAPARSRPVGDGAGRVFVATADGALSAWHADSGRPAWSARIDGLSTELHVAADRVVVGSSDYGVYCFAAGDGRLLWRYETGGIVRAAPTGTGRTVYVPAGDGVLYALNAADGVLRWRQPLDGPALTPASLGARRLAVTTRAGTVFLFEAL